MIRSRLFTTAGPNILALLVATSAITIAAVGSDPVHSGGSPGALNAASVGNASLPPAPAPPERLARNADGTQSELVNSAPSPHLTGPWALKLNTEMLQRGCLTLASVPDYSATFTKQERIAGVLSETQTIELKIRHQTFSVYMKWLTGDAGRQLIYVDNKNDGDLLVQPGGIKGRLTGLMSLDPQGTLAMAECRYPVTKVGLIPLAQTILSHQLPDVGKSSGYRCEMRNDEAFGTRPCYLFVCEYDSQQEHPEYRKSIMYIDQEYSIPVCVKNYTWGVDVAPDQLDAETLVEFYAYTDIEFNKSFNDEHFDEHNSEYHLRCKNR